MATETCPVCGRPDDLCEGTASPYCFRAAIAREKARADRLAAALEAVAKVAVGHARVVAREALGEEPEGDPT